MNTTNIAMVIGANGGIASALLKELTSDSEIDLVVAVSRNTRQVSQNDKLYWLKSDSSNESIEKVVNHIQHLNSEAPALVADSKIVLKSLFICVGTLHDAQTERWPEKRIEMLNTEHFSEVLETNTLVPLLWLKHISRLLNKNTETKIAVFSARVGSISDNELGGWYSYRASKAALNMLLKTLAIEFKRRFPKVKILAFHPGTTDTALSKPFQSGVPEHKLFSPEFVAQRLVSILSALPLDGTLSYLDWDNKAIPY